MSDNNSFPIGRMASLLVVVGLTAFPVVSCGPIEFKGHEILRNAAPDLEGMSSGMSGMGGPEMALSSASTTRDHLFESSAAWMHWLFVAIVVMGALSFFFQSARMKTWFGLLGGGCLLVFLNRFDTAVLGGKEVPSGMAVFDWDMGAYMALAGFGLLLFDAFRAKPSLRRSSYATAVASGMPTDQYAPPPSVARERVGHDLR